MTDSGALRARRDAVLGGAYRLFYDEPVQIVRGEGVWLTDLDGRRYLDAYNNVASVGHAHPRVVEALTTQAATLNTHTRYLHEGIVTYAERLVTLVRGGCSPGDDAAGRGTPDTAMFTCTGSEANDLALRLAASQTGAQGVIVTSTAYHGVTAAVAAASPSLGLGVAHHVRTVRPPRPDEPGAIDRFVREVEIAVHDLQRTGIGVAAFLVDSILSSDGLVPQPAGFLAPATEVVRAAGGLVIVDEVQAGFGRTGGWWGFTRHGLTPDIVTLGKPMGNGHPVGGVVYRRELDERLARESRYFNTFGGNPVSMAAAAAVLDVIEDEGLIASSGAVGAHVLGRLRAGLGRAGSATPRGRMEGEHTAYRMPVRDVRGAGLFVAVEVTDGATAARVVNALRDNAILISATGPGTRTLKIRPPLTLGRAEADLLVDTLLDVLATEEKTQRGSMPARSNP